MWLKTKRSMCETIKNLQEENKELKAKQKLGIDYIKKYFDLKNKHEKTLKILNEIQTLTEQNTYDRPDITLNKINELSQTANQQ